MLFLEAEGVAPQTGTEFITLAVPEHATREMRRRLASVAADKVTVLVQRLQQGLLSDTDGTSRSLARAS
jgi:hypothetical protein